MILLPGNYFDRSYSVIVIFFDGGALRCRSLIFLNKTYTVPRRHIMLTIKNTMSIATSRAPMLSRSLTSWDAIITIALKNLSKVMINDNWHNQKIIRFFCGPIFHFFYFFHFSMKLTLYNPVALAKKKKL